MASEDAIRQAIIIAGGLGTRARSMTGDAIPKALLPLAGVPIILRQIRILAREGIQHVRVLGGHLGSQLSPPSVRKLKNSASGSRSSSRNLRSARRAA